MGFIINDEWGFDKVKEDFIFETLF